MRYKKFFHTIQRARGAGRRKTNGFPFLETDSEKNTQAVLVGGLVRLNQTKNWSRYKLLLCLEVNKPNKQNVYEINFPKQLTSLRLKIINGTD